MPILRPTHHRHPHRIENDVARKLFQVGPLPHQDSLLATLEDVPATSVHLIQPLGVDAVELAHPFDRLASGIATSRW